MTKKILLLAVLFLVAIMLAYALQRGVNVGKQANTTGKGIQNENQNETRSVKLFYYDPSQDFDESGNIMCSRQGLVAVTRGMPVTMTLIQDTLKLLLRGELTDAERAAGISTDFPLTGVELMGAVLNNGVLTLEFSDPNHRTSGGSCRIGVLWAQIAATAEQFPEVKSVRFQSEELFQP